MKVALLAILFAFLATSFAITLQPSRNDHLLYSKLGSGINSNIFDILPSFMQTLQQQQEYTTDEVIDTLIEIRGEYETKLAGPQAQLDAENSQYQIDSQAIQAVITGLQNKIDAAKATIEEILKNGDNIRATIKASQEAIQKTIDSRDAENARRAQAKANTAATIANIDDSLAAVEEVIALMKHIRDNDQVRTGGAPAFLQMRKKEVQTKLGEVQQRLTKMKDNNNPYVASIKDLLELAQGNGSNVELIDRIIRLVNDLRDALLRQRADAEAADKQDAETSAAAIEGLRSIAETEQANINNQQNALAELQGRIDGLNQEIEGYNGQINDANLKQQELAGGHAGRVAVIQASLDDVNRYVYSLNQGIGCVGGTPQAV